MYAASNGSASLVGREDVRDRRRIARPRPARVARASRQEQARPAAPTSYARPWSFVMAYLWARAH